MDFKKILDKFSQIEGTKKKQLNEDLETKNPYREGFKAWTDYLTQKVKQRPSNLYYEGRGMGEWEKGAKSAYDAYNSGHHGLSESNLWETGQENFKPWYDDELHSWHVVDENGDVVFNATDEDDAKNQSDAMNSKGVKESAELTEKSAPGQEEWIRKNKKHFIDQYGKEKGLQVLYATAYKRSKQNENKTVTEKWDTEYKTPESKKGMFNGKTKAELEAQLVKLKKSGPHEKDSKEYTKMKELQFAIRAKSNWK